MSSGELELELGARPRTNFRRSDQNWIDPTAPHAGGGGARGVKGKKEKDKLKATHLRVSRRALGVRATAWEFAAGSRAWGPYTVHSRLSARHNCQ